MYLDLGLGEGIDVYLSIYVSRSRSSRGYMVFSAITVRPLDLGFTGLFQSKFKLIFELN